MFHTFHTHHVCKAKLVDKLFEDVLLALAPAHEGEEHAEDGNGEHRLVYRHLRHNCPEQMSICDTTKRRNLKGVLDA